MLSLSPSSSICRYQLEINYQFQVLQRGRESVHDSFEIAGTIYKVTHIRGASTDEITYYPYSDKVPHNYSEKKNKYKMRYPEQFALLENYKAVLQSETVIENMRKLDLFHEFNESLPESQGLPEIIKLSSADSFRTVSKEPTTQQVEAIYKQSVILRGHNATHREFYINNLKLMISTDSTATELTSPEFNVDFHSDTAISDSGLSIVQAEKIKKQVEITVNNPTVQEDLRNEPIQNRSVRINKFLTEKCALMMPIAQADLAFSDSIFTGTQDNWQDEMLSFASNTRLSDARVLELFKHKPICEALKTELNIKSSNPPLIFILMKINALKEIQPILAYDLAYLIKEYERHNASHCHEETTINYHIINELTVICENIKQEVEAISLELSKILSDEKAIQSAYLESVKRNGAVQTHHSFVYQHLTIQLIENPNNQNIKVSPECMSTSAVKLSLTEALKKKVQANIESAINQESIQCQAQLHNNFWHQHTESFFNPVSDEKIQLLVIHYQGQEELKVSEETLKSEYITDKMKQQLDILPLEAQIECYREFDSSDVCSVERKTVVRQLPLIIWLEIIDALMTTNPTRALVIYTSITNELNPRMLRTLNLEALKKTIILNVYDHLGIANIDELQTTDPKTALKLLEKAGDVLPEQYLKFSDIHKKIKFCSELIAHKTQQHIDQFKDDSSISKHYISRIQETGLVATHKYFRVCNLQMEIILHADDSSETYKVAQVELLDSPDVELTDDQKTTQTSKLEKIINDPTVRSNAIRASQYHEEYINFLKELETQSNSIISSLKTDRILKELYENVADEDIKAAVQRFIELYPPLVRNKCVDATTVSVNTYNQPDETVSLVVLLIRVRTKTENRSRAVEALNELDAIKSQLSSDFYLQADLENVTRMLQQIAKEK